MATPGASISSGIGHGAAQVLNTSPLIEALQMKREESRKRRQLLDKELQDSLSDVDTSGIRSADVDSVVSGYNELVDAYSDIMSTEDSTERIKKQAEFNKRKSKVMGIIKKSIEMKEFEKDLAKTGMNTPVNKLSPTFSQSYKKLINTPVTDDSIVELSDFSLYQKRAEPVDLSKTFDEIAKASTKSFKGDFKGAGFGLVERESGSRLDYELFRDNFYQRAINNDDFRDQVEEAYESSFRSRTQEDKVLEAVRAKEMGISDYNPDSIDDYIVFQNFAPRSQAAAFNKIDNTVRSIPKTGSGSGTGDLRFEYKPITVDPTSTINITDGGKEETIPVAKSTPYSRSFNVNVGAGNNSYWDIEEGGWKRAEAGAYRFQSAHIVDVPFVVGKDGKERLIREELIGKFQSGEAQRNDNSIAEAYYRPMIVGTLDVPIAPGESVDRRVMIPLEQFPTNTRLTKNDAAALEMHTRGGGGQLKVDKSAIEGSNKSSTKEKIDW